jgi:hypothetical protein
VKAARIFGILLAVALAAGLLSACQHRVGTAALVGSARISESDLNSYVAQDVKVSRNVDGSTDNPKSDALDLLIVDQLLDEAFKVKGGAPSPTQLAEGRAAYLSSKGISAATYESALTGIGFRKKFADIDIDANVKYELLATAFKDTDGSKTRAYLAHVAKVDVNPRYGSWDASTLNLNNGPAVPSFLTLAPTPAPTATTDAGS